MSENKPIVLAVLDGWGLALASRGNAIEAAKKPNFDKFWDDYPHSTLTASGADVGLKDNEPGNSEAGHENMGAGRTVIQDKILILNAIHDGTFFKNAAFIQALNHAKENKTAVHLMGLLSDERSGHMEPAHLEALLLFFKQNNFDKIFLHIFTDGRDTPPRSVEQFLKRLHLIIKNIGVGKIATIAGRYYGMDRAHNYERLYKSYQAIVLGEGESAENEYQAIQQAYARGESDEFITPTVIRHKDDKGNKVVCTVKNKDAVIFFNLRSDRARQITKAFVQPELLNGETPANAKFKSLKNIFFVTMTEFGTDLPVLIAYPTRQIENNLPTYLAHFPDIHQFYISESEKFAHVTYFFHGNSSKLLRNEKRLRVDSKKSTTFDETPAMSAKEIVDALIIELRSGLYNFSLVNFPNADMLGHTGNMRATVKAIQAIDEVLGRLYEVIVSLEGTLIITADHGNAEQMIDSLSGQSTHEHSINRVPFIIVNEQLKKKNITLRDGSLRDVAPTILDLMGLDKPLEMYGISLLKTNT